LSANFRGTGGHLPTSLGVRKLARVPGLLRGVVCEILRLAVLIQYRRVAHTQTDTQTHDDGYYPRTACAARVKMGHATLAMPLLRVFVILVLGLDIACVQSLITLSSAVPMSVPMPTKI